MPTRGDGALASLDWPKQERQRLARASLSFKCPTCGSYNLTALPPEDLNEHLETAKIIEGVRIKTKEEQERDDQEKRNKLANQSNQISQVSPVTPENVTTPTTPTPTTTSTPTPTPTPATTITTTTTTTTTTTVEDKPSPNKITHRHHSVLAQPQPQITPVYPTRNRGFVGTMLDTFIATIVFFCGSVSNLQASKMKCCNSGI